MKTLKTVFLGTLEDFDTAGIDGQGMDINTPEKREDTYPQLTLAQQAEERQKRLPGYEALRQKNADIRGWIFIPGTGIDHPVMQTSDRPNFYLKHNFDKQKSSYGTPYLSEFCDLTDSEKNIIIYGHHMRNGTMFADLMKYREQSYLAAHPVVWFDTMDETNAYEVKAVMTASASDTAETIFELAGDGANRQIFLDMVEKRSVYDAGELIDSGEPLLILMTCEYSQDEGRLLVIAERIDVTQGTEGTVSGKDTDTGKDGGV